MKVASVSSINNVSQSQNSKKAACKPNFGLFVLADAEAGEALVEKIIGHGNVNYVSKLVDLITLSKSAKDIVYISSKDSAKVYTPAGLQICPTNGLNEFGALYMALGNVVGKYPTQVTEAKNLKQETIGEVARRLVDVLKDCPMAENIEKFFQKLASKGRDSSQVAA